jgi:hypothetical protein
MIGTKPNPNRETEIRLAKARRWLIDEIQAITGDRDSKGRYLPEIEIEWIPQIEAILKTDAKPTKTAEQLEPVIEKLIATKPQGNTIMPIDERAANWVNAWNTMMYSEAKEVAEGRSHNVPRIVLEGAGSKVKSLLKKLWDSGVNPFPHGGQLENEEKEK